MPSNELYDAQNYHSMPAWMKRAVEREFQHDPDEPLETTLETIGRVANGISRLPKPKE